MAGNSKHTASKSNSGDLKGGGVSHSPPEHKSPADLLSSPRTNDYDSVEEDIDAGDSSHHISPTQTGGFDMVGSMYKRRGGLGKNSGEKSWVMRTFTLYGPILCYHEEPDIESVNDHSKPRARLNLSKTETIAEISSKQKPGLPTADLLTVNIYDPIFGGKRKWLMCCTSKEQQLLWYKAINNYDGKPTEGIFEGGIFSFTERSGNAVTTQEMERAAANSPSTVFDTPDLTRSKDSPRSVVQRTAVDDVELIAKAAARAAQIMKEEESHSSTVTVVISLIVSNVAFYVMRNGSEQTCNVTVCFMNILLLYVALQNTASKSRKDALKGPKARAAAEKQRRLSESSRVPPLPSAMATPSPRQRGAQKQILLSLGSTLPRALPTQGNELERQVQGKGITSSEAIRAYSAAPTDSVQVKPHTYANTDASTFNLRVGPNYKKNKQKEPSGPALYDLVSVDFVFRDTPLNELADKFLIPTIPGVTDVDTGHSHIPPMLVINTWLPGEEPSMFSKNTEGETYSIPMVFVLSTETLRQLKNLRTASPAVKLFSEWCRAEAKGEFFGRFKCMGMIEDIESTNVPQLIQGYNGKPALVNKSGKFTRHQNYIEFTVNINLWGFLARKGLYTLTPSFPQFILNIGFTIEARKEEEMPECLLGGVRVMNLNPDKASVEGVDDA